jgi:hypothetical protein
LMSSVGQPRPTVVIEVKYVDRVFSREEIQQAIAYSAAYRCPVVLIRPRRVNEVFGNLELAGEIGQIRIETFLFDLNAPDAATEDRRLVSAIRGLILPALGTPLSS